jgi:Fungal specific transcription factor domain
MFDNTGDGWMKHIFYGTSRILQIRGPKAHLTGPGRSFFLTVRLFEICRSCFYPEPTFLREASWISLMDRMWEGDLAKEWHPKENLLDIMISCSSLGHRSCPLTILCVHHLLTLGRMVVLLNPNSTHDQILEEALHHLASEGISLRNALSRWLESFKAWMDLDSAREEDPRSTLANIYFHAISIYLSGLFDYRYQFNQILSASLPSEKIQIHVREILHHTGVALKTTRLAGILFFFPLRVAGARAKTLVQRAVILAMLDRISERSFVVAQAFSEDLQSLWRDRT